MGFMTSVEAGEKWSLSKRRVAVLCAEGRIPGAEKKANVWLMAAESYWQPSTTPLWCARQILLLPRADLSCTPITGP